jgi:hypothetical protein
MMQSAELKRPLGFEEVHAYLRNSQLVLLQYFTPDADIDAVYPQLHQLAAGARAFVDFVSVSLQQPSVGARRSPMRAADAGKGKPACTRRSHPRPFPALHCRANRTWHTRSTSSSSARARPAR